MVEHATSSSVHPVHPVEQYSRFSPRRLHAQLWLSYLICTRGPELVFFVSLMARTYYLHAAAACQGSALRVF
jgi:hypothetical protein